MEEINANFVRSIDFSHLANKQKPQEQKAPEQKTGDLTAYLDNVGNSQRLLVKGESPEKKQRKLKEEMKFLKKNYPDLPADSGKSKDAAIKDSLEDFHFLVRKMPTPKSPDELGEKSYDDYRRHKALEVLSQFQIILKDNPDSQGDINAAREAAYKKMTSGNT